MLKGEDSTKPKAESEDEKKVKDFIQSAAMMLRYSFDMAREADAIENAVSAYLDAGYRTADIMSEGMKQIGCEKCGEIIASYLK